MDFSICDNKVGFPKYSNILINLGLIVDHLFLSIAERLIR